MKLVMMSRAKAAGWLAIICLFFYLDCREGIFTQDPEAVGTLGSYEGCKPTQKSVLSEGGISDSKKECFEYDYDGSGTLHIKHINAGFNCCPGKIVADITIENKLITLKERETDPQCRCLCLFDVNYIFEHVKPGVYRLRVTGPCHTDTDELLEFTMVLTSASRGTHCLERDHYPWGD